MADEEDPWGAESAEPEAAQAAPGTPKTSSTPKAATPIASSTPKAISTPAGSTPKKEGSIDIHPPSEILPVEEDMVALPPPGLEDDGYRKPVQLYKHWVRPKFLQYKYMYNYRTNYYDDVIDYLDKKQVGVAREIPRPQTWAERVLRTNYSNGRDLDAYSSSNKRDNHLIQTLAASIRTYNYHTKAYINQKYASVL